MLDNFLFKLALRGKELKDAERKTLHLASGQVCALFVGASTEVRRFLRRSQLCPGSFTRPSEMTPYVKRRAGCAQAERCKHRHVFNSV